MKNIRIRNDIRIKWSLYRYGKEEDLTGQDVVINLLDPVGRACAIQYEIEGNMAIIEFFGSAQEKCGAYTLVLTKNPNKVGMVTIDKVNAFSLVAHSQDEGGCGCNPMVSVESVSLTSDIDVPANGKDGLSAYEIAVKNGFVGTEQEWLASLAAQGGVSRDEWLALKDRVAILTAEIATLKQTVPIEDADGNGIPDGEDRLQRIEESVNADPMTEEQVNAVWDNVFNEQSEDQPNTDNNNE